jgi:hypothetical protein
MKQAKRGRPPKGAETMMKPVTVRFPAAMMAAIEGVQASRADEPEMGQGIRELVALGLERRKRNATA